MFFAFLGCRANVGNGFGQMKPHFAFDEFHQGDVGKAGSGWHVHERTTESATASVELTNATGDEVDENVGIAN